MARTARELYASGMGQNRIAREIGRRYGMARPPSRGWVVAQVDSRSPRDAARARILGPDWRRVALAALRMSRDGATGQDICNELGITQYMLTSMLGDMRPSRSRSVSVARRRMVSPERLALRNQARELYNSGTTNMAEIGRQLGVARRTVNYWIRGENP